MLEQTSITEVSSERILDEVFASRRPVSEGAEQWLYRPIRCLDHGFVYLVDYMGSDEAVVQAARVSYGKGTKKVSEDRGLIRYLRRHLHTTPFEMVEFKFHCKMPIFVARQWIRHRTANVNEYSGRYSVMKDEFYVPEHQAIHFQSGRNKQGRSDVDVPNDLRQKVLDILLASQRQMYGEYEQMLQSDIARELARINLPLSLYTEWYWKIDLHNLLHFLKLRLDAHAQYEIRVYAEAIAQMVKDAVPFCFEAFEDYQLESLELSQLERGFIVSHPIPVSEVEARPLILEMFQGNKRETEECIMKLKELGRIV